MKLLATISFLLASLISFAKPYFVDIDKTLKNGKFFGEVVVLQYVLELDSIKKSNVKSMTVKFFGNKDSIFVITKLYPTDYYSSLIFNTHISNLNCYWPQVGDTVLIALDSTYALTFFGEKSENNKYKIYTPFFTGSVTTLLSKKLFDPIKWGTRNLAPSKDSNNGAYRYIAGLYATKQELLEIKNSN